MIREWSAKYNAHILRNTKKQNLHQTHILDKVRVALLWLEREYNKESCMPEKVGICHKSVTSYLKINFSHSRNSKPEIVAEDPPNRSIGLSIMFQSRHIHQCCAIGRSCNNIFHNRIITLPLCKTPLACTWDCHCILCATQRPVLEHPKARTNS